jgi:DNA-binding transcriptional LysR family regulator
LIICAAPTYLARHGAPESLGDLAFHRCSVLRHPGTGKVMPWDIKTPNGMATLDMVPALCTNEEDVEIQAALSGQVIAPLTGVMAVSHIRSGRWCPCSPSTPPTTSASSSTTATGPPSRRGNNPARLLSPQELAAAEAEGRRTHLPRTPG